MIFIQKEIKLGFFTFEFKKYCKSDAQRKQKNSIESDCYMANKTCTFVCMTTKYCEQ